MRAVMIGRDVRFNYVQVVQHAGHVSVILFRDRRVPRRELYYRHAAVRQVHVIAINSLRRRSFTVRMGW